MWKARWPGCVAQAAQRGVTAEQFAGVIGSLKLRPVITAHPTEAKRVTVLELHRRIYRLLMDLESPRWTERERAGLIDHLRGEIELLWLTGELRLEKPTVDAGSGLGPALLQRDAVRRGAAS